MNILRQLRLGALAISTIGTLFSAQASAYDGNWYISGSLGFQVPETIDINPTGIEALPGALSAADRKTLNDGTWQYRGTEGMSFTGAVGKYVRPNLRLEGELNYLSVWAGRGKGINDVFVVPNVAASFAGAKGEFDKTRLLFSVIYDITQFSEILTPYIGIGIGYTSVDLDNVCVKNTWSDRLGGSFYCMDGQDDYFTYALHAGFDLKLRRNLSLTTRYTVSNREEMNFKGYELRGGTVRPNTGFTAETDDGFDHAFSVGLKYTFGGREETYKQ